MITFNTSIVTDRATPRGVVRAPIDFAAGLLTRLSGRSRVAVAGVGCFVAVVAGSASLSASAMAATSGCTSLTASYSTLPISATLSGDLCHNGSYAWDPNPGATKLTDNVPSYLAWDVTVLSASSGNYNYASGSKGTEEIWGNVIVHVQTAIGLGSKFGIYLRLDCTPSGHCTTRAWAAPLG